MDERTNKLICGQTDKQTDMWTNGQTNTSGQTEKQTNVDEWTNKQNLQFVCPFVHGLTYEYVFNLRIPSNFQLYLKLISLTMLRGHYLGTFTPKGRAKGRRRRPYLRV